jgi:hypothetical protein
MTAAKTNQPTMTGYPSKIGYIMETETLDKLYLELSQITKARTCRELQLEKAINTLIEAARPIIRKHELNSDESALYDAVLEAKRIIGA